MSHPGRLAPSRFGHVVYALYDETFPAGAIVLTAEMRDGSVHTERIQPDF